jgi:hypothetical protein
MFVKHSVLNYFQIFRRSIDLTLDDAWIDARQIDVLLD